MSPTSDADRRPRASVIGSIVQGWSRVLHAPWVAAGALVVGFILHAIDPRTGHYVFEGRMLTVMTSEVHEIGAQFYLLFRSVGGGIDRPLLAFAALSVGIWTFLAGGIFDRLARARRVGAGLFFWACGRHYGQFVRLGLLAGVTYWALSRWLYPQLQIGFGNPQADLLFLAIVGVADVFFLFAAVRVVVEDRRSVLAALAASWRFIGRRLVRVTVLMLINGAIVFGLVAALMATNSSAAAFGVPLFLLGRAWARMALIGSAMVFFQNELAHAHYTAAPVPTWPDSPAVEAIENLKRNRA